MINSTTTVVGSVIKVSGTGVIIVTARTDIAAIGMTAGWDLIASPSTSATATAKIIRPWLRMVIMNGRRR